jgi:Protein of unknown function (DUF5131)
VITQARAKALLEDYRTWEGERVKATAELEVKADMLNDEALACQEDDAEDDPAEAPEEPASASIDGVPVDRVHLIEPPTLVLTLPPVIRDGKRSMFNRTIENVDWAKWSWNPVTGCLHDCEYCYAREMAQDLYREKFAPTFRPERLSAPHQTKLPKEADSSIGWRHVLVCSMADLFGKWVPQEWIDAMLAWLQFMKLEAQQDAMADLLQADEAVTLQSLTGYAYLVAAIHALCA